MTFGICLFIFIIQFLWQHIDKLVGKGLDTSVIVEFFTYASIMLVPQALPLAVLLASLMTFGNMGERMELVAIKASGVSLMKIMKPMIILISFVAIASFIFQNNINPRVQVRVYSLLYSIKQQSPELDIPEGAFYSNESLKGYSIYVKDKDLKTHMLRDVIIYDTSRGGFRNMSVDVADSAMMKVADSKDYLVLTMFNGERFTNSSENTTSSTSESASFLTESYERKDVVIPFDGEFTRIDESNFSQSQLSKNLVQLEASADSMQLKLDSLNQLDRRSVFSQSFLSYRKKEKEKTEEQDSLQVTSQHIEKEKKNTIEPLDIDSVFESYSTNIKMDVMRSASSEAKSGLGGQLLFSHLEMPKPNLQKSVRLHRIFWHKMFSLSFACLIFFFIGAPLGAIIRKGGLGMPVIISVLLFIIYYIIDQFGYKMARDGQWPVWQGVWLSTSILFPLGVFLTYKSMRESALFNVELYGRYFRQLLRVHSDYNRNTVCEPRVENIPSVDKLGVSQADIEAFESYDNNMLKDIVNNFAAYRYSLKEQQLALAILKDRGTYLFDVRVNNYDLDYSAKLINYFSANSMHICIPLYVGTIIILALSEYVGMDWLLPIGILSILAYLIFYAKSIVYVSDFYKSINKSRKASVVFVEKLLSFLLYPIYHSKLLKQMRQELNAIKNQYI